MRCRPKPKPTPRAPPNTDSRVTSRPTAERPINKAITNKKPRNSLLMTTRMFMLMCSLRINLFSSTRLKDKAMNMVKMMVRIACSTNKRLSWLLPKLNCTLSSTSNKGNNKPLRYKPSTIKIKLVMLFSRVLTMPLGAMM